MSALFILHAYHRGQLSDLIFNAFLITTISVLFSLFKTNLTVFCLFVFNLTANKN